MHTVHNNFLFFQCCNVVYQYLDNATIIVIFQNFTEFYCIKLYVKIHKKV